MRHLDTRLSVSDQKTHDRYLNFLSCQLTQSQVTVKDLSYKSPAPVCYYKKKCIGIPHFLLFESTYTHTLNKNLSECKFYHNNGNKYLVMYSSSKNQCKYFIYI